MMIYSLTDILASRELQRQLGVRPSPDGTTIEIDRLSSVWLTPTPSPYSWREILRHLRNGLHFEYPPCCVLQWVLGHALGVGEQCRRRGTVRASRPNGREKVWVPCIWHRGRCAGWRPYNWRLAS
jgi:hypothetical protein